MMKLDVQACPWKLKDEGNDTLHFASQMKLSDISCTLQLIPKCPSIAHRHL